MSERNIPAEEAHLLKVLSSERFLKMEGLGNEVPFFIWAYPPDKELDAQKAMNRVVNQLTTKQGLSVLTIDLYDLAMQLLKDRGVLEQVIEIEPDESKPDFRELLQGMLDPEQHLAPAIGQRIKAHGDYDILVLVGIGKVFPFIRSHNVLNNIQTVAGAKPMLMLFPGEYRQSATLGSALVLFDQLTDDQYYRAKNIQDQEA
ncbi:MAG: DUF1788 domain-containing protein [Propionibacteriaceae bacterium]|jgi:hypothetical protein|nr:DUF1788 domain-containing protein [Propionibacteriaceae bacterium]